LRVGPDKVINTMPVPTHVQVFSITYVIIRFINV
jgi:hypothetical protein